MQTDLQKIMGMEFSEDKVQYLVYQMLKGLKVGGACMVAKGDLGVESQPSVVRQRRVLDAGGETGASDSPLSLSLSVHPLSWYRPQGECSLRGGSGECVLGEELGTLVWWLGIRGESDSRGETEAVSVSAVTGLMWKSVCVERLGRHL